MLVIQPDKKGPNAKQYTFDSEFRINMASFYRLYITNLWKQIEKWLKKYQIERDRKKYSARIQVKKLSTRQ